MDEVITARTRARLVTRLERAVIEKRVRLDSVQLGSILWALFPEDYATVEVKDAIAAHRGRLNAAARVAGPAA